jgi:hypothetical protein
MDVNWQNTLIMSFTEVLSFNIFTQLIYDDDIKIEAEEDGVITSKPRIQFKSVLGAGLTYKFGTRKDS